MTVPQFSKEVYVFFLHVEKNILTKLFGFLCNYISPTISITAIGYARNINFKIYQTQAVRLFAYSQNLTNHQEEAVQRLKPLLTSDMRDQLLFFTQVTKDMEQEGTRSERTWIHYMPPHLTLRGQPATSGTDYLSLSFSVYLLISYLATYFFQAVSHPASAARTKLFRVRFPFKDKHALSIDSWTFPSIRQLLWYQAKSSAPQDMSNSTSIGMGYQVYPCSPAMTGDPQHRGYKSWEMSKQGSWLGRTGRRDGIMGTNVCPNGSERI